VRYAFIREERSNHSILLMCGTLEVSRSGYYKWLKRKVTDREQTRIDLLARIKTIFFEESRQTYGSPRIYRQLRKEGWDVNHKTVEKLMQENGISPRRRRKHKSTTDSKHQLAINKNVLDRDFSPDRVNEAWVSDITYIETHEGWLYLAAFIDLHSRKVVGWSMSDSLDAELVVKAYQMALDNRSTHPLIVHSDRGCQYASAAFRKILSDHCIQSMSRKANCWDNAVSESFWKTLKSEMVYHHTFRTRNEARTAIFDYVEIFYNKRRLHSSLGYLSPEEFEQKVQKAA
jgi:putative transposase